MNSNIKTAIFWVVLICVAVLLLDGGPHRQGTRTEKQITFTEFLNEVEAGKVKAVTISGNEVHGVYQNESERAAHHDPGQLSGHLQDAPG